MAKYDVIIAGSGLGGLLSGYILSKEGQKVCILEQHHQIGGCLQTFVRNECIFDTGMHYIGSMAEGQSLNYLFRYFGLTQKLKLKRLDINAFDIIDIAGEKYNYAQGFDHFTETMCEYFPSERAGIVKYVTKLKAIGQSLTNILDGKSQPNTGSMANFEHFYENAKEFICSVTENNRLQNVLAALNPLYAGKPESAPLYLHGIINHSLIESSYRMVDGGSQIADILAEGIKSHGGEIITRAEVTSFVSANDGSISHVLLSNGEQVEGNCFISNINPATTIELTKSDLMRQIYKKRIKSIDNTISIFSLYIVFKENTFPYLNHNFYKYNNPNVWGVETYSTENWPDGHMLYTPASSKSEQFADTMIAITYMKYDELSAWANTTVEKRGEDYKNFKKAKAEMFIDRIGKQFPGIRDKIKTYYTSTPLTYRDYTGTLEGSIYGIMKDCNNPLKSFILPRTKIPNLLMTGQNINLHGVLGVTIGSLLTCGELIGFQNLLKKIKDAS
jgi:all-trans-retinol 13,14-reductase